MCIRNSKLASSQSSIFGDLARLGELGSVELLRFGGSSKSDSCQLKVGSMVVQVPGASSRKAGRFVLLGASRIPGSASAASGGKFNSMGIPQLTMGSTGRGVTSGPAKPGWLSGRAG